MITTITTIIIDELLDPRFGMTMKYLKTFEVKYEEDNKPKILKIDYQANRCEATAYVEVKNEKFYLGFIFVIDTTDDDIQLYGVRTVPFIEISFMPISMDLSTEDLLKLTSIKPTYILTKGGFFSNGKLNNTYNGLEFESFPEPRQFEEKLRNLLDILETDVEGIKQLSKQTNTKEVFVTINYHIGDGNIGGLHLNGDIIDRLSKLGLELTFDIYATGEKFVP